MDLCKVELTIVPTDAPHGFKTSLNISLAEVPLTSCINAKISQMKYNNKHEHFFVSKAPDANYILGIRRAFLCTTWEKVALEIFHSLSELTKELDKLENEREHILDWVTHQEGGYALESRMFVNKLFLLSKSPDIHLTIVKEQLEQQHLNRQLIHYNPNIETIRNHYIEHLTEFIHKREA